MITASAAAALCRAAYDADAAGKLDVHIGSGKAIFDYLAPAVFGIGIPGTDDPRSTLCDLAAIPRYCTDIGVPIHMGMKDASDEMYEAVAKACVAADCPVWITGHSLGGSLALITAARLNFAGIPIAGVTAFAPARISTGPIGDRMRGIPMTLYRFGCDEVPLLPVALPFWTWQHPVSLTQLGNPEEDIFPGILEYAEKVIECHRLIHYATAVQALEIVAA